MGALVKSVIIYLTLFLIFTRVVSGVSGSCFDNGAISFIDVETQVSAYNDILAKHYDSNESFFKVPGKWTTFEDNRQQFDSEEAIFIDKAEYSILYKTSFLSSSNKSYDIREYKKFTLNCPGLGFSCKIIKNMSINSCYNQGDYFFSEFSVPKFFYNNSVIYSFEEPYNLSFLLNGQDKEVFSYSPKVRSNEFNFQIDMMPQFDANKFLLKWKTQLKIKDIKITHDKCTLKNRQS